MHINNNNKIQLVKIIANSNMFYRHNKKIKIKVTKHLFFILFFILIFILIFY